MNSTVYDFVYNGIKLSDFGSIISVFGSSNGIVTSQGSSVAFQNIKTRQTQRFVKTGISYDDVLTTTIQVSKNSCESGNLREYTQDEIRAIMKWLNNETYSELQFISDVFDEIYFKAYANVNKITTNNKCIGFEITFTYDSNFGYRDVRHLETITDDKKTITIPIDNDRQSFLYPIIRLTMKSNGDLEIFENTDNNRKLVLRDCSVDEIIEIDCEKRIIKSSDKSHDLPHSFNFIFPRIDYRYTNDYYDFNFNLNCNVDITITEVRKIGVI